MNDALLRDLVPEVTGVLVRRGADFAAAEDAVQDALVRSLDARTVDPPDDPKGWLITVAWHKFVDAAVLQTGPRSARRVPGPGRRRRPARRRAASR